MYWTKKHVLVCTASHCGQKGAMDVVGRLRLEVVRRGLDAEILVNNCGTIDLCDIGPNLVVYPEGTILSGVSVKDLPAVIAFLTGGPAPEHLVLDPRGGREAKRARFYAAAWNGGGSTASETFQALAAEHGFDDAWIGEQQRRGFIARKPAEGGDTITVTKKARDRYGLAEGPQ